MPEKRDFSSPKIFAYIIGTYVNTLVNEKKQEALLLTSGFLNHKYERATGFTCN